MRRAAYIVPGADLSAATALAADAEHLGYESVWVTHGLGRDSFLVLAAYGAVTHRLGLGNGVVPIYPRHPVAMAQAALTLAETMSGRFTLGIGVSHKASMETMLGVPLVDPLGVMREYVAVLRGALGAGADFEGKYYRVRWSLAVPGRSAPPRVFLAALSPRMCELAGEIADGAILWLCPPSYVRETAVPAIERGRSRAGRARDGFEIVCAVPLAVTDERARAMAAFRDELARYASLPFYRAMLQKAGHAASLAEFDRSRQVPEPLAEALGAVGEAKGARAYVDAYRAAGVTLPAIRPITFPDAPWYRRTLEEASGW